MSVWGILTVHGYHKAVELRAPKRARSSKSPGFFKFAVTQGQTFGLSFVADSIFASHFLIVDYFMSFLYSLSGPLFSCGVWCVCVCVCGTSQEK